MNQSLDPYAILGVDRTASLDEIRLAHRIVSLRFQPDKNPSPAAADEYRLIGEAYEVLGDPAQRAAHDATVGPATRPLLRVRLTTSRDNLPTIHEPQVVYGLVEIGAEAVVAENAPAPPVNLCLVIDRSTSMQGERLDQVKRATLAIIDQLTERDAFSMVAFSDRAEVTLPAQRNPDKVLAKAKVSTLFASGGTEILQGLVSGIAEIQRYLNPLSANHLILLTDGRTYGDEDDCLSLANLAARDGINIHGLGMGAEWNDEFLDDLAGLTGGSTTFGNSPKAVGQFFGDIMRGVSSTFAERLSLTVTPDVGITLQSAFRSAPHPAPINVAHPPLRLGNLRRTGQVEVLLQFAVPPANAGRRWIARVCVQGDVIALERMNQRVIHDVSVMARADALEEAPPVAIVNALSKLAIHRLQEKAAAEAAAGQIALATQRLERLASRLLASGEKDLAKTALVEARRLERTKKISSEGQKTLKFGTRALISPDGDDG